jgi:hypothetical protein
MHRTIALAVLLAAATPASNDAHSQGSGIFDAEWAKVQSRMSAEQHTKCDRQNPMRRTECYASVRRGYVSQGIVPGTNEYAVRRYGALSPQELNQQIIRLNRTYGLARHVHIGEPASPGEVSHEMIEADINAIRQLIRARGGLPS